MEQEKPLCVLFMDIHKMMHDRMRRQSEALGLQFGYHRIIFELAHKGLKTQNEIAAATNRSSPTVSVALQNMEKDGIVTRHQSADDQRKILVELTEKGKKIDEEIGKTVRENDELFVKNLTEEEIAVLTPIMRKIYDTFVKENPDLCE